MSIGDRVRVVGPKAPLLGMEGTVKNMHYGEMGLPVEVQFYCIKTPVRFGFDELEVI